MGCIDKPSFSAQIKDKLLTEPNKFNPELILDNKILDQMVKSEFIK